MHTYIYIYIYISINIYKLGKQFDEEEEKLVAKLRSTQHGLTSDPTITKGNEMSHDLESDDDDEEEGGRHGKGGIVETLAVYIYIYIYII
jgi:hypothetical protein